MPRGAGRGLGTIVVMMCSLVAGLVLAAAPAGPPALAGAPPTALSPALSPARGTPATASAADRKKPRTYLYLDFLAPSGRSYRPHRFTFAEDPSYVVLRMHWTKWTHSRAKGHGTFYTGFGHGPYHTVFGPYAVKWAVRVTFRRPRLRCGHEVFTRGTFVFPGHPHATRHLITGTRPGDAHCA